MNGDPHIDNPTPERWFNTAAFSRLPDYTPRSNPWQYPGMTGPGYLNIDASLVKSFAVTERFRFALRMDSFNVLNNMTWTTRTRMSTPARLVHQPTLENTYGRRTQLGLRVEF